MICLFKFISQKGRTKHFWGNTVKPSHTVLVKLTEDGRCNTGKKSAVHAIILLDKHDFIVSLSSKTFTISTNQFENNTIINNSK